MPINPVIPLILRPLPSLHRARRVEPVRANATGMRFPTRRRRPGATVVQQDLLTAETRRALLGLDVLGVPPTG